VLVLLLICPWKNSSPPTKQNSPPPKKISPPTKKKLDAAEKKLDAAEKRLDAAEKKLDAAEKDLAADPKCKVRKEKLDASLTVFTSAKELYTEAVENVVFFSKKRRKLPTQKNFATDPENQVLQAFFTSAKDLFNSANKDVVLFSEIRRQILQAKLNQDEGMKKGHAQRIIRERPKLLEAEDDRYDASSIYVPHEIKNIDELRIPSIRPIPVNRGQTSLPAVTPASAARSAGATSDLAMGKLLAAARKELAAAKKELDDAEKKLDADPKCKVREKIFTFAMEYYTEAHRDVVFYSQKRRKLLQNQAPLTEAQTNFNANIEPRRVTMDQSRLQLAQRKLLPPVNNRFNACITYTPHETVIRDIWQKEIPEIKPITVNLGQVSLLPRKPHPWNLNSPLTKIVKITEFDSCQIALPVINFLTTQRVFSSENGVHAIVNYFTEIVVESAALGKSLQQERDRNDASSTSESTGSSKSKKFRVDSIIALKGKTLVRIEEKKAKELLPQAQRELVKKISKDWVDKYCNAPFIIGIAVAGNIWTFHRITSKHVQECQVPKKWLQIDTDTGEGRLRGLQVAVHIASLLRLFSNTYVRDRSVPFETTVRRAHCRIFITQKDNPHVKKWYDDRSVHEKVATLLKMIQEAKIQGTIQLLEEEKQPKACVYEYLCICVCMCV